MANKLVWAKRPFDYGIVSLDREQTFELAGSRNDEKLLRLGYVEPYSGGKRELNTCDECGAVFLTLRGREMHFEKRHLDRGLTPQQEDDRDDAEERMLEQVAPLDLGKTEASMKG
jgi:hypothetical protein